MSLFSAIDSFAKKVESEIEKLWSHAPSFVTVASTVLTYVGPILETVFTIEAGAAAGNAVTAVINKAETDLLAAKSLITTIGATPSVQGLISGVQSDLSSLLTLGSIKDATSIANVKLVLNELDALITAFPTATPAPATT